MTKNYTIKDVAKESLKIARDSVAYYNIKNMLNHMTYVFRMSSGDRVEDEIKEDRRSYSGSFKPGTCAGETFQSLSNIAGLAGVDLAYRSQGLSVVESILATLGTVAATNLASAGYEVVRKAKKNLDGKSIDSKLGEQ